jgi:AcrR family transcriptional regulator
MLLQPDPTIHRQVVATAREVLQRDPSASVSRIARDAGVSRATFYRHFGSRGALLQAVEMEAPVPARERVLEAAAELIGQGGLHSFSMERLATAAGVSRATVYRLYPTKAALFGEIVRHFSPFEPAIAVVSANAHRPPQEVIPMLVRTFVSVAAPRLGLLRAILLEASSLTPDAVTGVQPFMPQAIGALAGYLASHMDAGLLRRMDPILAVQALMGPIFIHLLTRPIAQRLLDFEMGMDEAVDELTATILGGLAA